GGSMRHGQVIGATDRIAADRLFPHLVGGLLRENDLLAALAVGEWGVFLYDATEAQALALEQRIRRVFEESSPLAEVATALAPLQAFARGRITAPKAVVGTLRVDDAFCGYEEHEVGLDLAAMASA
ncbi:MAG: hypothetical protein WCP82_09060, partial [Alphaproteobacteria bacterium]